jgi:tRNA threonylcarbamoyladenosine modification (KEOPS) complex  Pcc1 subunit
MQLTFFLIQAADPSTTRIVLPVSAQDSVDLRDEAFGTLLVLFLACLAEKF